MAIPKIIEPQVSVKDSLYGKVNPKLTDEKGESIDINKLEELLQNYLLISTYRTDRAALNQTISDIINMIDTHTLTVDDVLSLDSINPVQNKVITEIINELQSSKQDQLTAGDNIIIDDNVISSIDTKYDADDNLIHLNDTTFTVDSEINDSIESLTSTWSSEKIQRLINSIDLNNFNVVDELPLTDINPNTIYLIPSQDSTQDNVKDEYIYIDGNWELIGSTKVDLSNYYTKSQVYNTSQVDEALESKQNKLIEGNNIDITDNVISAIIPETDLSDYYTRSQVDNSLNLKQDVITGSNGEVVYHNGSSVFTQSLMNEGYVVTNQDELDLCKNTSPSFKDVFSTWRKFSHLNATDNAVVSDLNNWSYDSVNDTIKQPNNSTSYTGFISPKSYSTYDITVRLYSDNQDDDILGIVAAFAVDSNGKEHTLSFIRTTKGVGINFENYRWACILDFRGGAATSTSNGQKILVNRNNKVTATNAGWDTTGVGTLINVVRRGNVITAKCSQFNSSVLDDNTLIEIDLDELSSTYSVLNLFKGASPWGYSTFSQPDSMYENISITNPDSMIYDLINDEVLEFNSSTKNWDVVSNLTPIEAIGKGRFSFNNLTNKLFFNNGSEIVNIGKDTTYKAGTNISISDSNVISSTSEEVKYTAGNNIQISDQNVISATDTTYQSSDFDIKDLSDSTDLKSTWNSKQDRIISGNAIELNNNEISVKYDNDTITLDQDGNLKSSKITIDSSLSDSSENPVQNKVIKSNLDNKVTNLGTVSNVINLTQDEYDELEEKDEDTLYLITDAPKSGMSVHYVTIDEASATGDLGGVVDETYNVNDLVIVTDCLSGESVQYEDANHEGKTAPGADDKDLVFTYLGNREFRLLRI